MSTEQSFLPVTDVKIRLVESGTDGLLAWASCVVSDSLKLDNISIRHSKTDGRLFLTYPAKQSTNGDRYPYFNPISKSAAKGIEEAILTRLAVLARPHSDGGAQAT